MAKKTNKTEHVLNLLMGQNEAAEDAAGKSGTEQAAEQNQAILNQTVTSQTILKQTILEQTVKEQRMDETPAPARTGPARPDGFWEGARTDDKEPEAELKDARTPGGQTGAGQAKYAQTEGNQGKSSQTEAAGSETTETIEAEAAGTQAAGPEAALPDSKQPEGPSSSSPPPSPLPGIKFVESSKNENNPISSAIKESLEREAVHMGIIPPPEAGSAIHQENSVSRQEALSAPAQDPAPLKSPLNGGDKASQDNGASREGTKDADYIYINIMEEGIKEACGEYMVKLGVCTCDRCRNDVMALALSNLPSKYIVTEKTAASPLLNFYRNKFSSYFMAELTKACFAVSASPRH